MKQERQKYQYKDENYWQWGCCEFNNKDRRKRFRLMPFSFRGYRNFFYCRFFINNNRFRKNKS